MKRTVIAVAALAMLAPLSAQAEPAHLSDWAFANASHCLAYAELPQLQSDPVNTSALRDAVNYQRSARSLDVINGAAVYASHVRTQAASSGNTDALRARRDQLCHGFIQNGLVQLETATPAT
ncbi:MAG: hypothetical protein ABUS57_01090 [Pseudomonadota bacterium]